MAARAVPGDIPVRIVPMKRRHLTQVLAIEHSVYTSGWSRAVFLQELLYAADRFYIVAKVGRRVVGYVGVMFSVDEGHITTIAVHADWQRHRIATRLMLRAVQATVAHGLDALTLEVRASNVGAQALYERFGFQSVGMRPGYYQDNREDAVVMWAHGLSSPPYRDRIRAMRSELGMEQD